MIAPTIIIGLGGIGSDICCRVSKLVRDETQRKRLRFVCIDTDINDLRQRRAEDSRIITIQTSAPYTVGSYLKENSEAREQWFPLHNILNGKTPTEGAGQVRAISRLAFDTTVREGKEMPKLEQAIEELYYLDGASDPQAIRVMIVSTLAGGTGSGIVLPTALYIRHFLTTRFRKNASVIRGFFLLPEIMFGNKSAEEQASLCCNAYASMRELDAFTRRGDGALEGSRYKDLHLMMPDSTTSDYVDYDVSPFNFCFLYDKRNTDDLQLMSLVDYKEHAANTIYTQTMSGISSRSNSNEDNTIKSLVASNGRNRFCGAGSSLLKYPRDDVLSYIADHWAAENMSEEWLTIDKAFTQEYQSYKERKKKNPTEEEPRRADHYMFTIENPEKGSFADRLHGMLFDSVEQGIEVTSVSKVDQYVSQLYEYISSQVMNDAEVTEARRRVTNLRYILKQSLEKGGDLDKEERIAAKDFADELEKLERECVSYARVSARIASRIGRAVATSVFQNEADYTADTSSRQHMEYFMKDADGKFIHPNAARYYIYALNKLLSERLQLLNSDGGVSYWERKALRPFDDLKTPDEETIEDSLRENKVGQRFFVWYMDKRGREDILSEIDDQIQAIEGFGGKEGYALSLAMRTVYSAGVEFLGKLSEAFERFYQNLSYYMDSTRNEAAEIQRKYVNGEGKATRYVCASSVCLERMLEEMPCQAEGINGNLSAAIFQEMKNYAMLTKQPNASTYFSKLYNDTVMGYWRDFVYDLHSEQIDMDVITALENEAEYENQEGLTEDQKQKYVEQVLEEAERLAAPFIEEPMGEVRHPFHICAYNQAVAGEPESTRRSFVNKYINEGLSGQVDDNVSPYELMVYRAIYNLSAGDFMRFRAPEGKEEGGIYYRAYMKVYDQLGPNTSKNEVITPHIDRHWHLTKYLPDLSDENQKVLEDRIYTAFAWGMLSGKIQQKKYKSSNDDIIRVRYVPFTRGSEAFVVPNGTHCDELYEVVDALEINPPQVLSILKDMQDTMQREKTSRLDLRETKLINCLQWKDKERALGDIGGINQQLIARHDPFCLIQYAESQKASMFDLLYWHKFSTPATDYDERVTFSALDSMVSLLEYYVSQFEEDDTACHERCFEMLKDQFTSFVENLKDDSIKRPAASRRIQDKVVSDIAVILDDRIRETYGLEQHLDGTMLGILADARK